MTFPREDTNTRHAQTGDALATALGGGRLRAHFQPKFAMGRMVGVEALARWEHPMKGLVAPAGFLPLCRSPEAAAELTRQMTWQTLRFASRWKSKGHGRLPVAINIAAEAVLDPAFHPGLDDALRIHGHAPADLTLEILEDTLTCSPERLREPLGALRRAGYRLSIDDFGTGAAGMQRLLELPVDELKVARQFIHGAATDHRKAAIVEAAIGIARNMGLVAVLEGVEDDHDLAWLERFASPRVHLQGYGLGRPMCGRSLMARMH